MITVFVKESNNKWYLAGSAIIFTVLAVAHLAMIIWQVQATLGEYTVPYELNGVAVVALGYLAARGFMAAHKL